MDHPTRPATIHLLLTRRAGRTALAAAAVALGACMISCGEEQIEEQQVPKGSETVPDAPAMSPASPAPAGEQGGSPEGGSPDSGGSPDESRSPEAAAEPWVVPAGWSRTPGERPMRIATYEAPGARGPVEVAITRFPGNVGGELANINRWRGQMGLSAIDASELESVIERFEAPGYDGYQARIEGADMHMLAAGVYEEAGDRTWFVRANVAPDEADELAPQVFGLARSIAGLEAPATDPGAAADPEAEGAGGG